MTRDDAERHARELGVDDKEHRYFTRERDGDWEVVRVRALPSGVRPSGTATEARPRPEPADPRQSIERLIPPFGPGT